MSNPQYGEFRTSTRSDTGNCVEVADRLDRQGVAVRDSKDAQGPTLSFDGVSWRAFIAGVTGRTAL